MNDLIKFYNSEYKDVLNNYYVDLVGKRLINFIKYFIIYGLFSLIVSVLFVNFVYDFKYKYLVLVLYNVIIFFLYIITVKIINIKEYRSMNEKVLCDLIYFINGNNSFVYKKNFQLKQDFFKNMDIFNFDLLNYAGFNLLSVPYKNNRIVCSDVDLFIYKKIMNDEKVVYNNYSLIRRTVKKIKHNIFHGFYIELNLSKICDSYIYLVPNNVSDIYLNSYINYKGEKVILEDIDFNKKYSVYSSNQINSRYILSISLMDKINKLDIIIPNKKYIVFKDDSTVGIFINNFSFSDILDIKIPIKRDDMIELEYLKKIYDKINVIFSIYDLLDLDNDLYSFT